MLWSKAIRALLSVTTLFPVKTPKGEKSRPLPAARRRRRARAPPTLPLPPQAHSDAITALLSSLAGSTWTTSLLLLSPSPSSASIDVVYAASAASGSPSSLAALLHAYIASPKASSDLAIAGITGKCASLSHPRAWDSSGEPLLVDVGDSAEAGLIAGMAAFAAVVVAFAFAGVFRWQWVERFQLW